MDISVVIMTIFLLPIFAQAMAIFMWAIGWWCYKTDSIYRVQYGKPSFWIWNQIKDNDDKSPESYRHRQKKERKKLLEKKSIPELQDILESDLNGLDRDFLQRILNKKYRDSEVFLVRHAKGLYVLGAISAICALGTFFFELSSFLKLFK